MEDLKRKRSRKERKIESKVKRKKKSDVETAALSRVLDADIKTAKKTAAEVVAKVVQRYKCDSAGCTYSSDIKSNITRHQKTHTGDKPHKCDFLGCVYACTTKQNLNQHKKTHMAVREKPHKCDFVGCVYTCTTKQSLNHHKMTHTGEKPNKCDFVGCGYTCTQKNYLKVHKLTHTGGKPHKCEVVGCGFTCSTKQYLKTHKMTHTGEKPQMCDFVGCGYACAQKCNLIAHQRIHTGEKPYKCDAAGCVYACTQQGHLITHKRIHTGEKPYPCEDCDSRFTTSSHLRGHERYHERSALWTIVCPFDSYAMTKGEGLACGKKFEHGRALDYHIQAAHTVDGLRKRLKSELRMADWLDSMEIKYDRDYANMVHHSRCPGLKDIFTGKYSRPDFHLYDLQVLQMLVLLGNDENSHRRYSCEADRMMKITAAIGACKEFHNVPILYIRFNPHFYEVDGKMFDPPLETRYAELARVINRIAAGEFVLRNPTGLNVVYMYYPKENGEMSCLTVDVPEENREFVMVIKDCVCEEQ